MTKGHQLWSFVSVLFFVREVNTAKRNCICAQKFPAQSVDKPAFLVPTGMGTGQMFLGEATGRVHILNPDGSILPTPFLDIQADVLNQAEKRLHDLTPHPDIQTNRKFYVFYNIPLTSGETGDSKLRLEEIQIDANNVNQADLTTRRVLLDIVKAGPNHMGGALLFGDDGYLYVSTGDSSLTDPAEDAQILTHLLGKVLRIDVDSFDIPAGIQYGIPTDNPFFDGVDGQPEIYAWGFRNPYQCSKVRAVNQDTQGVVQGTILCGDVGQNTKEEIDIIAKKANYGWRVKEGTYDHCPMFNRALPSIPFTNSIYEYDTGNQAAVIGGFFYNGCQLSGLKNKYIYGDYSDGLKYLSYSDGTWSSKNLNFCGRCAPPLTKQVEPLLYAFGEDENGELYMIRASTFDAATGSVYKIVPKKFHPVFRLLYLTSIDGKTFLSFHLYIAHIIVAINAYV